MKKTIDPSVGEFGIILLIHGLYHRTWEVARYHTDKLSNWIPSIPGTRDSSPSPMAIDWLPRNPTFSKWRNTACDCLDVLHWSANSQVAISAGVEHPIVLHLHLARLILLTPVAAIQSFASTLLENAKNGDSSQSQYHEDRVEVLRWVVQDQYKARLALAHAGAIFWHVRRYSSDGILEPFSMLLATLVIWAYAKSSQAIQQQRQGTVDPRPADKQTHQPPEPSETTQFDKEPDYDPNDLPFINLDRLCDDELIQMYVLHGAQMQAFMAGIGDIRKEGAPIKILREGARIIACAGTHRGRPSRAASVTTDVPTLLPTWGIGIKHALFLEELAANT